MDENAMTISRPQQRDVLLKAKRDGLEEVIVVNEALLSFAHPTIFSWYLCVTLEAKDMIDNGRRLCLEDKPTMGQIMRYFWRAAHGTEFSSFYITFTTLKLRTRHFKRS